MAMERDRGRWLVKTEPAAYSFARLQADRRTVWDGVSNPLALKHLRAMAAGDEVLVYHTGDERAVVGVARVAGEPYPDPKAGDPKLTVVDLEPVRPLPRSVPLAAIKQDPAFAAFALVRMGRLSVMPVPAELWDRLLAMAGA
jgi:predicted RNA-binding protein with PUA-like domain